MVLGKKLRRTGSSVLFPSHLTQHETPSLLSIRDALIGLLAKPIAESTALCIPTAR